MRVVFLVWRSAARMRRGVAGISSIVTPNGASASLMALRMAAGAPMAPPSPRPLAWVIVAPFSVSRCNSSIGGISRQVGGRKSASVAVSMLPIVVVDDFFQQGIADALRDAAEDLAIDDHRIDETAGILRHHELFDGDQPGLQIDLDDGGMTGVGERAGRIVGCALGDSRVDLALEEMRLVIGRARQGFDRDRAVGADHPRGAVFKHDVVRRGFQQTGWRSL